MLALLKGLKTALRSVAAALALLTLVIFAFGIVFVQITLGTELEVVFPSIGRSMYILLIHGAFCDDMAELLDTILEESTLVFILMLAFILVAAVMVLNMLVGILSHCVSITAVSETESLIMERVAEQLQETVEGHDGDAPETISRSQFQSMLENPDAIVALEEVGIDVLGLFDVADCIFQDHNTSLQGHESETCLVPLSIPEFISTLLSMRGENNATVKNIVDLRTFMRGQLLDILEHMKKQTNSFDQNLGAVVKSVAGMQNHIRCELRSIRSSLNHITESMEDPLHHDCQNDADGLHGIVHRAHVNDLIASAYLASLSPCADGRTRGTGNSFWDDHAKDEAFSKIPYPTRKSVASKSMGCADETEKYIKEHMHLSTVFEPRLMESGKNVDFLHTLNQKALQFNSHKTEDVDLQEEQCVKCTELEKEIYISVASVDEELLNQAADDDMPDEHTTITADVDHVELDTNSTLTRFQKPLSELEDVIYTAAQPSHYQPAGITALNEIGPRFALPCHCEAI